MSCRLLGLVVVLVLTLLVGCGDDVRIDRTGGVSLVEVSARGGFEFPTQLFIAEDAWYLAQLAGGENDMTGSVLRLDPSAELEAPVVLLENLDKPTGVAVFAGELWVMERRRLTRGPLDGTSRTVVVDDMAFNGRSQGTLTVDGDRLLFNTSGSLRRLDDSNVDPEVSSGVLWAIDPFGEMTAVASGFKHAYAQTRSADGRLWSTEMSDGRFDGALADDELVEVVEGVDHGWPRCVGDNRPVAEQGADASACAQTPGSHALFEPGATPTSVVVAPWDDATLLVALWNRGQVVAIDAAAPQTPATAQVVFDGVDRPQHLAVDGDTLVLVDFLDGRLVELAPG